ncbi:MAG: type II secretion system F family protein [Phycisphaeraceae bacterium]|nr:type II secretion system F family protein [Phycisphaeraceae bacterium]
MIQQRALSGEDFVALNRQMAYLAQAGMPLERGLRLLASDLKRGRLAVAIREVEADMSKGMSLAEAMEANRGRFPPLYSQVLDSGMKSGKLGAVLMSLAEHLDFIREVRFMLVRIMAYPVLVVVMLAVVMLALSLYLIPSFQLILEDFDTTLPPLTQLLLSANLWMPWVAGCVLVLLAALLILITRSRHSGLGQAICEWFMMRVPVLGPALLADAMSRWCNLMRVAVEAGMPLTDALDMAGQAMGSPAIEADSQTIRQRLERGQTVDGDYPRRAIPATISAMMDLGAEHQTLGQTLELMAQLYQRQARSRLQLLHTVLLPASLVALGLTIGFVVIALILPLVKLISSLT